MGWGSSLVQIAEITMSMLMHRLEKSVMSIIVPMQAMVVL
jgi:hypothetical protein